MQSPFTRPTLSNPSHDHLQASERINLSRDSIAKLSCDVVLYPEVAHMMPVQYVSSLGYRNVRLLVIPLYHRHRVPPASDNDLRKQDTVHRTQANSRDLLKNRVVPRTRRNLRPSGYATKSLHREGPARSNSGVTSWWGSSDTPRSLA